MLSCCTRAGSSLGQFFKQYLEPIKLNDVQVDWKSMDLSYLLEDKYAIHFANNIKKAKPVSGADIVQKAQNIDGDVRIKYTDQWDFENIAQQFESARMSFRSSHLPSHDQNLEQKARGGNPHLTSRFCKDELGLDIHGMVSEPIGSIVGLPTSFTLQAHWAGRLKREGCVNGQHSVGFSPTSDR
ncbi:hypothetical protein TSUD_310910 [Trifolium subterraneum]|uniref:Alpha-1,3-mannosyl-glycoprotein 2-beta-N-acetylglucosaminyltransferase n=1 Tax=Trifolium subterraneum TaxID=3900 RepID=A0A2Z6MV47_TRISU|nr:hypothetical protein TSUD_310910 [Trifolium subterraneum]